MASQQNIIMIRDGTELIPDTGIGLRWAENAGSAIRVEGMERRKGKVNLIGISTHLQYAMPSC